MLSRSAQRGAVCTTRPSAKYMPCLQRRSLHVMRFKEGDKEAPEAATEVPDLSGQQSSVHHGHLDPIKRSRDALNKLLGRHSSSEVAAPEAPASRQASSSTTPAFEAPLSVPVFSRRREVGCAL